MKVVAATGGGRGGGCGGREDSGLWLADNSGGGSCGQSG